MTNYSYHLGTNSDPKSKISLSSFFSKKAKSYDSLQSANGRDKVGKSTFYDETNQGFASVISIFPDFYSLPWVSKLFYSFIFFYNEMALISKKPDSPYVFDNESKLQHALKRSCVQ